MNWDLIKMATYIYTAIYIKWRSIEIYIIRSRPLDANSTKQNNGQGLDLNQEP